jgi:hypothetical protein
VAFALMAAGMTSYFLTMNSQKESVANHMAVKHLKENPVAQELLGEIKKIDAPVGKISSQGGGSGRASFSMWVKGAKAEGNYSVSLERQDGIWKVSSSQLQIKGGPSIDLGSSSP